MVLQPLSLVTFKLETAAVHTESVAAKFTENRQVAESLTQVGAAAAITSAPDELGTGAAGARPGKHLPVVGLRQQDFRGSLRGPRGGSLDESRSGEDSAGGAQEGGDGGEGMHVDDSNGFVLMS